MKCNVCGSEMKYHKNEEIFVPVGELKEKLEDMDIGDGFVLKSAFRRAIDKLAGKQLSQTSDKENKNE